MGNQEAQTIETRPVARPRTRFTRWLLSGGQLDEPHQPHARKWYLVVWLTGVDYFSTLGYQPGIALLAAGALSPIATAILVGVTLLGALPVYSQVASRSYAGQGSIAMLENLLPGWTGKLLVLVLLGFAGTDFVITITLSAADATQHAIENPLLHPYIGDARLGITIALLALLAIVFFKGFAEAIGVAAAIAIPYLLLNVFVMARCSIEVFTHPDLLGNWQRALHARGDWTALLVVSALIFPKLALGLSGFETGVSVMPLVEGDRDESQSNSPVSRIRATRKLLLSAALIMSVMLVASSFVTALLIPEDAYRLGGPASGRAIAYLAHLYIGEVFGTIYDVSTIVILWFAGASAMAGLLNLIPRYLPRFGMAPRWVAYRRPLVTVLFAIAVVVTIVFNASVEAQGGAYATGVLVLILSASIAVALALWKEHRATERRDLSGAVASAFFWFISLVFGFTLVDNVIERPDGVIIASVFIAVVIVTSAVSRYFRATELRVAALKFSDRESAAYWAEIKGKKVHIIPLKAFDREARRRKAREIKKYYSTEGPFAFLHVELSDNRSEFISSPHVRVSKEDDEYVILVTGATAIANTIAYVSELVDPKSIFLGLTRRNLVSQSLRFLLWGEGETGLLVYTILVRYWEWTPEDDVRPLIFLMSE